LLNRCTCSPINIDRLLAFFTIVISVTAPAFGRDDPQCRWTGCGASTCESEGIYPYEWGSSYCSPGRTCSFDEGLSLYCCETPTPYSETYWLGTSPFCGVSCSDCTGSDECIIPSNDCGDGLNCLTGTKVLCGKLNPDEQLRRIPTYAWIILASILVIAALCGLSGATIYCCFKCNCCSST